MDHDSVERENILKNRHEFILQYYNMAVQDLDRHLKIGWQTIAVVAGAIATLSLGEQGPLPIFVSISAALIVLFWGLQNVIDSNYWSLRAIGFLANVESVYFAKTDQTYFNHYAGEHPPYHLMDSLKYQFNVCIILILTILGFFGYKILLIAGDFDVLISTYVNSGAIKILVWQFPIFVSLYYLRSILLTWARRHLGYLDFVLKSPGPGMAGDLEHLRNVNFSPKPDDTDFVEGIELQSRTSGKLQKFVKLAKFIEDWNWILFVLAIIAMFVINFQRANIFT